MCVCVRVCVYMGGMYVMCVVSQYLFQSEVLSISSDEMENGDQHHRGNAKTDGNRV